jgi:dTDP-4-amino-4,6-dideoxygalactose transaminase
MIPFNKAFVARSTFDFLQRSIESGRTSGDGPFTELASAKLSHQFLGAKALLTPSCTHALELAIRALGIGEGDEVIVPSFTFTSTANAVAIAGATPVFVDIDELTQNISYQHAAEAITARTKAIFAINYGGVAAPLDALGELCREHALHLLEDNAHGLGSTLNQRPLGTFGTLATQSFHETKNIQVGEGGALIINDLSLVEQCEILREKGTNRSKFFRGQVDKYSWVDIGSSWLLADPLAAMLLAQLEDFRHIQQSRHLIWNRYHDELSEWAAQSNIQLMHVPNGHEHSAHMFYLVLPTLETRTRFIEHMKECQVQTAFHYQPLHSSTAGMKYGISKGDFRATDRAANQLVRLPLWAGLTEGQVSQIIDGAVQFSAM